MGDLTTEFVQYLIDLKAANATKTDTTTLVALDLPTVRAAMDGGVDEPNEIDDANTMYREYLTS